MIRVYVLGEHPAAWGCVGCREIWMDERQRSETGRLRFAVWSEGQSVKHGYSGRRPKGWLLVREVPA